MTQHRKFEELLYAHPDRMIVFGADGDVLFANRSAESLLTDETNGIIARLNEMQAGQNCEISSTVDGAEFIGDMRVVECQWDNAEARLAVIRDITEQKKLSARYRKLRKMQLIGRFAGGLAHDFGNILGCIDVLAAVAQKTSPANAAAAEPLQGIRAAAASGRAIVDQLLSLHQSQKSTPQISDPRDILKRVEQIVGPALPPEIQLHVSCTPETPRICVDPSSLEQALLNLAFNAREAMREGGVLSITCAVEAGAIVLRVSDTGRGIAPEQIPHMFELFHSTKPQGCGHGLGLAICRAIVEQLGGSIWVENRPSVGAQFTIALPMSLMHAESSAA